MVEKVRPQNERPFDDCCMAARHPEDDQSPEAGRRMDVCPTADDPTVAMSANIPAGPTLSKSRRIEAGEEVLSSGERTPAAARLSRRQLVTLSASSMLLLPAWACAPSKSQPNGNSDTIDGLLRSAPFFIAHRGSGDNWTEHTAPAYSQAIAAGSTAIEVSVHATSDGVLVCHHDESTLRLTGQDHRIRDLDYAAVSALRADARQWLGPAAPLQLIPKLQDVLDAHAAKHVIFIEDKQGTNTKQLLDVMDTYPHPTEHFVWKQPASSPSYRQAQDRGYQTWGYFVDSSDGQFQRYAPRHDLLGIFHNATDDEIRQLVGFGKPTICWEVHTRWMRERLTSLGVQGMMCSNIPYVMASAAPSRVDAFGTGLRAAGDLPSNINWTAQPLIKAETQSVLLANDPPLSYCLGSMAPVASETYAVNFHMRWTGEPPAHARAGLAFGQQNDAPYVPTSSGPSGYHVTMDSSGDLALFRRAEGSSESTKLATVQTVSPVAGAWMEFQVSVSPNSVRIERLDEGGGVASVEDSSGKGKYFSLCKNYSGLPGVEFRRVTVSLG